MIEIYSSVLEFAKWEHSKEKTQKCSKGERKVKILIVKCTFLRIMSPAFLALGLVQDRCQTVRMMDARRSCHIRWIMDNECQVDIYVSPS